MSAYSLFFDNTDQMNYGCRATSLALYGLLTAGDDVVRSFHGSLGEVRIGGRSTYNSDSVRATAKQALLSVGAISDAAQRINGVSDDPLVTVKGLKRRARYDAGVRNALSAIDNSDAIFINGEGSMIFTAPARRDLLMQLAVLAYAQSVGVEAHYVNAMVSPCPATGVNGATVETAFGVLAGCGSVFVRDPQSLRFLRGLGYESTNAQLVPDALFDWHNSQLDQIAVAPPISAVESFPESHAGLRTRRKPGPYACVSGASIPPGVSRDGWVQAFVEMVEGLRKIVGEVVLVVPDPGDGFLLSVAASVHAPVVHADTNVLAAAGVLSSAAVFVSGRYHPSIMASLGGVPLVHFGSNSHKCAGLRELLQLAPAKDLMVGQGNFVDAVLSEVSGIVDAGVDRNLAVERSGQLGRRVREVYSGFWTDHAAATGNAYQSAAR